MPLLQENNLKREVGCDSRINTEGTPLKNSLASVSLPFNSSLFAQSHFLMASQIVAATSLGIGTNPQFFHPGLFASSWAATASPAAVSQQLEELAAAHTGLKHNNNNIVSSSSSETKHVKRKLVKRSEEDVSSLSPTLSSPSTTTVTETAGKDVNRDKQFTCGECGRSFGYKHVLQNHERTHTGEKPFECQECHKRFTRDHHLKTHMRLHTGERPYHCDHCDRQFVQVANLRRHLRVHTGERPYSCAHCSAKFSDSNQLKAHLLIHTNEKPFACDRCKTRFRRRHHLLHHKCGITGKDSNKEIITEIDDDLKLRRTMSAPSTPLLTLPLQVNLPEQTEPEDLSMSTGCHSHSSGGDSPRSPSSKEDLEEDYYMDETATLFLQRRPPSIS